MSGADFIRVLGPAISCGRSRVRCAAAVVAAFASGWCQASILTFDQVLLSSGVLTPTISGFAVPPSYGDRITGTTMSVPQGDYTYGDAGEGLAPNVLADFFAATATPIGPAVSLWQDQYGDLTNVLFGNNSSQTLNVRLTADGGFAVQLYGFDLAGWANTDYTIAAVRVIGNATTLFSQENVLIEGDFIGNRHTSIDFAAPLTAAELLIQIDYTNLPGGQHDNIGLDNVRFGQTPPVAVPLPIPLLLLGGGFAVIGSLAARQRQTGNSRTE